MQPKVMQPKVMQPTAKCCKQNRFQKAKKLSLQGIQPIFAVRDIPQSIIGSGKTQRLKAMFYTHRCSMHRLQTAQTSRYGLRPQAPSIDYQIHLSTDRIQSGQINP
jgi:hypothetical protein